MAMEAEAESTALLVGGDQLSSKFAALESGTGELAPGCAGPRGVGAGTSEQGLARFAPTCHCACVLRVAAQWTTSWRRSRRA